MDSTHSLNSWTEVFIDCTQVNKVAAIAWINAMNDLHALKWDVVPSMNDCDFIITDVQRYRETCAQAPSNTPVAVWGTSPRLPVYLPQLPLPISADGFLWFTHSVKRFIQFRHLLPQPDRIMIKKSLEVQYGDFA
jgi:hypothetical protein